MATVNSARSNYRDVIAVAAAGTGALTAIAGVQVEVRLPGTVTKAVIYGSRNPADLTPLANPLTTAADGIVNFWAEVGEYDLFFHDTIAPARIADQTIGWSSLSPVTKGIPAATIRDDAALSFTSMAADAMRQFVPLGTVLDWWRPFSTYDAGAGAGNAPTGFEICDGRTIAAASHDFGGGSPIVLPDLRNKFIIGADILKTDATASVAGDGTAAFNAQHPNAPGIRGLGGANSTHLHSVPSHFHGKGTLAASGGSHGHTDGGHSHGASTGNGLSGLFPLIYPALAGIGQIWGGTQSGQFFNVPYANNGNAWNGGPDLNHGHSVAVNTGAASINANTHSHPSSEFSGSVGNTGGVSGDAAFNSVASDGRPAHYGLLKIMKVRRS